MNLTIGIDEVGYGPSLGPMVVAGACASGRLPLGVCIGDSKKVFSQQKGIGTLEPAVLGFLRASTFADLLCKLSATMPDAPWYGAPLGLPLMAPLPELAGSWARLVEPAEFNRETKSRNKSDFLFDVAAGLINQVRAAHPGRELRFVVGKHGGRAFYLRSIQTLISSTVMVIEESRERSAYQIPGATIEFLMDAEAKHELVALASMIGKYVRECAMKLFNDWWARHHDGLRRTAGYGADGRRFFREIQPYFSKLNIAKESVLRLR